MPSCPECNGSLSLAGSTLRDAHGSFVPASALRQPAHYATAAALMRAASEGAAGSPCPSCRAPLASVEIPVPGQAPARAWACAACGGAWFPAADAARVREAVLSRPPTKARQVGGYGGYAMAKDPAWTLAEGVFRLLAAP